MKKFLCLNPIKYSSTNYSFPISWSDNINYPSGDTSFFEIPEDVELNKGDTVRLTKQMILQIGEEIFEELEGDTPLSAIMEDCRSHTLIRYVFNYLSRHHYDDIDNDLKETFNILSNKDIMLGDICNLSEEMFMNILSGFMDHCDKYDEEIGNLTDYDEYSPEFYVSKVTVDFKNMYKIYTIAIRRSKKTISEEMDNIINLFEELGYDRYGLRWL